MCSSLLDAALGISRYTLKIISFINVKSADRHVRHLSEPSGRFDFKQ
jgi:hypothetical protein